MVQNLVVLVDTQFHFNVGWTNMILQTKQSGIDLQLFNVSINFSGLQIMDAKKIISETNRVGRSETVWGIVEDLFRRHLITDSVIHIHVQSLLRLRKFLPQKNTLSGECVKNSSFLCCQKSHIGVRDFIIGVIDPVILTCTKEGVLTFKVGMPVEVHSIPPLYFPDTQSERMTYRSSSRHSSPDLGAS